MVPQPPQPQFMVKTLRNKIKQGLILRMNGAASNHYEVHYNGKSLENTFNIQTLPADSSHRIRIRLVMKESFAFGMYISAILEIFVGSNCHGFQKCEAYKLVFVYYFSKPQNFYPTKVTL